MKNSNELVNELIQWLGAVAIIAGHILNAVGPRVYPWNIVAFTLGTVFFLLWTIRVANKPQMTVNVVAMSMCILGLYRAWG